MKLTAPATDQPVRKSKQLLFTFIKVLISSALIYWILHDVDFSSILKSIKTADIGLLLLAYIFPYIGYYISALRWKILLKAKGTNSSIWFLMQSYLVAVFFNHFLPSTVGGDSIRVYDSYRQGKNKVDALTVVFIDRFLGLFALICFAILAIAFADELNKQIPLLYVWIALGGIGMAILLYLILFPSVKIVRYLKTIQLRILNKPLAILEKITTSFASFGTQKKVIAKAIALSFVLQFNVILYYFFVSLALGFGIPLHNFFVIVPLSIFVMMLPISINGIGLRENTLFFFLAVFAVSKPDAIAFAWVIFIIQLLQGVIGGFVYAFRK